MRRQQRGNCGGPFLPDLERVEKDDFGYYVEADIAVGGFGALDGNEWPEGFDRYYSCPVAASRGVNVAHVLSAWKSWKNGQLQLVEPNPSAALLDAVEQLDAQVNALNQYEIEEARKKHG